MIRRAVSIVALLSTPLHAATINIAFHNGGTTVTAMIPGNNPVNMGVVVDTAAETWNDVANNGGVGPSFSGFALALADGGPSGATLAANSGFTSFNNNGWGGQTKDWVMMEGWYGFRDAESITVSNLPAEFTGAGYTVTIYGDSNTTSRTMDYVIGGQTRTIQDTGTYSGTLSEGDNYVTFTGLTDASFTISGNTTSAGRSAVNGIVITSIPETSVALLGGIGLLALLRRRR